MKTVKITAIVLAMLMLAVSFVGCSDADAPETTTASTQAETNTPETTLPTETEPVFDEANYGGAEFVVYGRTTTETYGAKYIDIDDATDAMESKTIERNAIVENKYGINIVLKEDATPYKNIEKAISSGDIDFDVILDRRAYLSTPMQAGLLMDFHKLDHIDFSKPYWDSNAVRDYEFAGKLFHAVNDISTGNLSGTRFIYFNKAVVETFSLPNPYELVAKNEWTLDNLLEMVKSVSVENGDGIWDGNDTYGFLAETGEGNGTIMHMLVGCGVKLSEQNDDGTLTTNVNSDRTMSVIEKIYEVFEKTNYTQTYDGAAKGADMGSLSKFNYGRTLFANDHFLFVQNGMGVSELFKDMKKGFGIVPNPKYNSEQESYCHKMDKYSLIWAIPNYSALDIDRVGIVMEYWAYQSSLTVMPAYYEVLIKSRRVGDPTDHGMLDLIKNSILYDRTELFSSNITSAIWNGYSSGNFTSSWKVNENSIKKSLASFYDKIKNLE